ncbi:MAG TPA: NAD-dependent epimerase [Nitrosomonas sp.]|nr:NAD-dependent epimerase [Nitrosomonas sp.]HNG35500.1 NAD-dependent epimerase [Nitrosomonas sp.]HNJ37605.1 NAD-dependent epimerase [Nitrosomonas sp.]
MKTLVTGAAGFIGMHVTKKLLEDQFDVIGLDNLNDYYDIKLKEDRLKQLQAFKNFRFIALDIADKIAMEKIFNEEKFQLVINLAAQAGVRYSLKNPYAYINSNIMGFMNILEGCRHHPVSHLVYASSSSVYGINTKMPFSVTDNVDHPASLYAATKKSNELMAHTYSHLFGIPTTGLRFFTVYGPWGRPDMSPSLFAHAIFQEKPIDVFNHGKMQRDFTYIDDIVEGVIRILKKPATADPLYSRINPNPARSDAPYAIYNIGSHTPILLDDFIGELETVIGKKAIKHLLPMQPGDVEATYASVADLKKAVGFEPKTSLSDGIKQFIDWFRKYYGYPHQN